MDKNTFMALAVLIIPPMIGMCFSFVLKGYMELYEYLELWTAFVCLFVVFNLLVTGKLED